jgi:transposase-like protein
MRYPGAEKLEIIRRVEHAPLPVRDTLAKLGISRARFYRWYDRYRQGGPDALADRAPRAERVWKRIAQAVRDSVIQLAREEPARSPRELAARFTDTRSSFLSEAWVYRVLERPGLIASPAFIVIKAAGAFKDKTSAPNQLWQTAFTDLTGIGWGWFYLSRVRDDFSRYIVAWKLCTTQAVHHHAGRRCHRHARSGITGQRSGPDEADRSATSAVRQWIALHRRRAGRMARGPQDQARAWRPLSSDDPGQDRAPASDAEKPHPIAKLLPAGRS